MKGRLRLPGMWPPGSPGRGSGSAPVKRPALRAFLRALRRLDLSPAWEAVIVSAQGPSSSTPLRAELRERVTFTPDGEAQALAAADVLVAASTGALPAPGLVQSAAAAGAVPVVSRLPVYEELADKFPQFVDVLAAVRKRTHLAELNQTTDVGKLYEIWLRTRDEWVEKKLKAAGLLVDLGKGVQ